jgi:hypothetical protein
MKNQNLAKQMQNKKTENDNNPLSGVELTPC